MSQTLSIQENYLVVFVCLGICFGICPTICPKICHDGKKIKKIMVSRNLHQAHLLEFQMKKHVRYATSSQVYSSFLIWYCQIHYPC